MNRQEIQNIHDLLTRVTPALTGMPGGGGSQDKLGDRVVRIDELMEILNQRIEELAEIENQIIEIMQRLPDHRLETLLYKRYFLSETFEQIAVEMNFSWRQTMRLHKKALDAFDTEIAKLS